MTKRIKRKISLLLLNIQLLFTFFLPLSPLVPQALASEEAPFAIEQIEESYNAYYLVNGVVFAESVDGKTPSFSSQSGEDSINYDVNRLVIKTASQTYLLEAGKLVTQYSSDSVDLSDSDKNFLYNQWTVNGRLAETKDQVELGVEYSFPLNEEVKVTFTKLPEERSTLRIEEISLSAELQAQLGTVSEYAYDISTDMNDGEFEFDLVLPINENSEKVDVKYAETVEELESSAKGIEKEVKVDGNKAKVEAVDHMTIFVVTSPVSVSVDCSGAGVGIVGVDSCYNTLEEAVVAASSGDVIELSATTHLIANQILIDKNLTIRGTDKSNTILSPTFNTASSGDARGWILVNSGANLDLQNLTMDGSGQQIYQAIRANDAGVVNLDNIIMKNIRYSQYTGFGFAVMDTDGSITNSTFENIERVGALLYFDSSYEISNNVFIGNGSGDWVEYAVELGAGAEANIHDNNFSNYRGVASSDGSESAAILATTYYGLGTEATVNNNTFSNNNAAIFVGYLNDDTTILTAENNDFSGNDKGVDAVAGTVTAINNWWGSNSGPSGFGPGTGVYVSDNVTFTPWLLRNPSLTVTVDEFEDSGIFFVKQGSTEELNFALDAQDLFGEHVNAALWGYDPNTGSRNSVMYTPWHRFDPDSSGVIDEDVVLQMVYGKYVGTNNPGDVLPEGDYLLWVERYYDVGGYVPGSTITNRVTIDGTKPTGKITSPVDGSVVVGGKTTIEGWASDDSSGIERVELRLRSNPDHTITKTPWIIANWDGTNFSGEIDTSSLPDGDYEVVAVAYDNAGNNKWFWPRPIVTVDNTAPDVDLTSPTDSLIGGTIAIRGSVTDDNPHHYWLVIVDSNGSKVAGPGTVNESSSFTDMKFFDWDTTTVSDGEYTIKLEARDAADNKDAGSKVWKTVTVDNTAPVVGITSPLDGDVLSGIFDIMAFVTDINLSHYNISLYEGGVDTSNFSLRLLSDTVYGSEFSTKKIFSINTLNYQDGEYQLRLAARDLVGNRELGGDSESIISVIFDNTKPVISSSISPVNPDGNNSWYRTKPEISLFAIDANLDKIEYQWDSSSGSWTEYTSPVQPLTEGTHTLYFRAFDKAGNESLMGQREVKWDQTAPDPGPEDLKITNLSLPTATLEWDAASDGVSGIEKYDISWKLKGTAISHGDTVGAGDTSVGLDNLTDGEWEIRVKALDNAGNWTETLLLYTIGGGTGTAGESITTSSNPPAAVLGVATGFAAPEQRTGEVEGTADEASEEEQAAMIEEMGGEVAGANSCEQARVWFWLGLALTFIITFFAAFLKEGWQKILAFILVPAIIAIVYSQFLGGACFNGNMMTWMNEVYWVPAYLTAIMAKLVTLFFIED